MANLTAQSAPPKSTASRPIENNYLDCDGGYFFD